jgi:hypothetical protein
MLHAEAIGSNFVSNVVPGECRAGWNSGLSRIRKPRLREYT